MGIGQEAKHARLIAFYLPQYHPIPENDEWWGKGFTEWTNVAKAQPLFKGHLQPKLPSDLGFYDLRVPEVRELQADLARQAGVEGFCYWHYWFGGGKRLLERPFDEVLRSGKPGFPFCLGWANQAWTGIWHGAPNRVLMEQTYPGRDDYINHFYSVLPALTDPRAISVEGKPLFVIYCPDDLPNCLEFTDLWRELSEKEGLPGFHFVGVAPSSPASELGLDGYVNGAPIPQILECLQHRKEELRGESTVTRLLKSTLRKHPPGKPVVCNYLETIPFFDYKNLKTNEYPVVVPGWDNTPRSGANGYVMLDSSPGDFRKMLKGAVSSVEKRPYEQRLIFLKSWNEWAEGNVVEPSLDDGHGYLEAIREEIY